MYYASGSSTIIVYKEKEAVVFQEYEYVVYRWKRKAEPEADRLFTESERVHNGWRRNTSRRQHSTTCPCPVPAPPLCQWQPLFAYTHSANKFISVTKFSLCYRATSFHDNPHVFVNVLFISFYKMFLSPILFTLHKKTIIWFDKIQYYHVHCYYKETNYPIN